MRKLAFIIAFMLACGPGRMRAEGWTLERAVQEAQEASPTVDRIDATVKAVELSRAQALARLGPTVRVSGTYTRNREEVYLETGPEDNKVYELISPLNQSSLSVSVSMPLVDPMAYAAIATASKQVVAAETDGKNLRALFRLAVANAYLDAVIADGRLKVATQTLDADRLRLGISQARLAIGKERRSSVLRIEADVLSSEQVRNEAESIVRSTREVLSIYVHQQVEGPLALMVTPSRIPDAPADVLASHPTVAAARARMEAAKAQHMQARMAFLPRLDGSFVYNKYDPVTFLSPTGDFWSANVTGSWTLFESGGRMASLKKAQQEYLSAKASYEEAREALQRDISRLATEAEAARSAVKVIAARVQAAEIAAGETQADYKEGQALLLDVQSADASLMQARSALIDAQAKACRALLSLELAYGRL